jgi:hypothetical protein
MSHAANSSQADLTQTVDLWVWAGCINTGELGGGDDEIYYLLSTNGGPAERVPALPNKGWNVSDDQYINYRIKQIELKPGESVKWILTMMEEDGGGAPPKAVTDAVHNAGGKLVDAVAGRPNDDIGKALVEIVKGLIDTVVGIVGPNPDDLYGCWAIVVKNDNGNLRTAVEPLAPNGVRFTPGKEVEISGNKLRTWNLNETGPWPRANYDVFISPFGKPEPFAEGRHDWE